MKNYVYAKLPRAGLGNKLLVWARASIFSDINSFPLFISNWAELKIGPFLRKEDRKRQYFGYFNNRNRLGLLRKIYFNFNFQLILDSSLGKVNKKNRLNFLYRFEKVPSGPDYFKGIREYRSLIRKSFYEVVSNRCIDNVKYVPHPVIGVHIRLSDFREPAPGEYVGDTYNLRTPIFYYIQVVEIIRKTHGRELPVTIFTDGHADEVSDLLNLPGVKLSDRRSDIEDLILLSQSQCIVVSPMSTFSCWAAFLSDAVIIKHPKHSEVIRGESNDLDLFEGSVIDKQTMNELFIRNIQKIRFKDNV